MPVAKKNTASSFIRVVLLAVIGATIIAGGLGYMLGNQNKNDQFSSSQIQFIDGVVAGTQYKADFVDWQTESKDKTDYRASPKVRCASDFFPDSPLSMQGCLMAIDGRPPAGYQPKIAK